jgi:hypothetical protein
VKLARLEPHTAFTKAPFVRRRLDEPIETSHTHVVAGRTGSGHSKITDQIE